MDLDQERAQKEISNYNEEGQHQIRLFEFVLEELELFYKEKQLEIEEEISLITEEVNKNWNLILDFKYRNYIEFQQDSDIQYSLIKEYFQFKKEKEISTLVRLVSNKELTKDEQNPYLISPIMNEYYYLDKVLFNHYNFINKNFFYVTRVFIDENKGEFWVYMNLSKVFSLKHKDVLRKLANNKKSFLEIYKLDLTKEFLQFREDF